MAKGQQEKRRLGERLVAEFSELRDALRDRKPVAKRFTVRTVELDLRPRKHDAESVHLLRMSLGVSQAIFAQIMGVSADLVASWEQGHREVSPMACRLLELIEQDKDRWLRLLAGSLTEKAR